MNFALIGAAGYIAPKHMKAIKDTGNDLVACLDPHDSVGILDSYFPECKFFTEFERFDRFVSKNDIDYLSICSPNYVHDAHIRYGLRNNMKVICEKPLVINPKNIDFDENVFSVLQLRYHPEIMKIKSAEQIILDYYSPRGNWYDFSWKGNKYKSGGLSMNIGIHLFDMLLWKFGQPKEYRVITKEKENLNGILCFKNTEAHFNLSIQEGSPLRMLWADSTAIDLSKGFENLHTKVYEEVLKGNGITVKEAIPALELAYELR